MAASLATAVVMSLDKASMRICSRPSTSLVLPCAHITSASNTHVHGKERKKTEKVRTEQKTAQRILGRGVESV